MSQESLNDLLYQAQRALVTSQEGVGRVIGVSRRTMSRWVAGHPYLAPFQAHKLARAVFPVDAALAGKLAALGGETLKGLGLQPASVAKADPTGALLDSVLCAAAVALDASPARARSALQAAFARARQLGLDLQDIDAALARPAKTARAKR